MRACNQLKDHFEGILKFASFLCKLLFPFAIDVEYDAIKIGIREIFSQERLSSAINIHEKGIVAKQINKFS